MGKLANLPAKRTRIADPFGSMYPGDSKHIKLVGEAGRQSVADFVTKWLIKEDCWRSDQFHPIVVMSPALAACRT